MADTFYSTAQGPSEGASISPFVLAFSGFLGTTWPLIRAERDLSGLAGQAWDRAVDAWIRDAEAAHDMTLAALQTVLAQSVEQDGDRLLRIVARIWDRVMRSANADEVADLRHFIKDKAHLFRIDRRDAAGRAVNRMLEGALLRLHIYIGFIDGPEDDPSPALQDAETPPAQPSSAKAEAELDPVA